MLSLPPALPEDVRRRRPSAGRGESCPRGGRADEDVRQTERVTGKQPWSMGASSGEKGSLASDNRLPPPGVTAARAAAGPTETSVLCHSEARRARQWATRDSASSFSHRLIHPRCVRERYRRSFLPAAVRLYNQL
ncbi:unnamed protein product [Pleuronectes platessa]|uniref:Uncharacterized protein n=1 Tax=Pleuronectes platessa TaxID=8262 RepID=A0A9N7Y9T0_PLEPL|nr:unnamed protein product [Pleuronectes platessa]